MPKWFLYLVIVIIVFGGLIWFLWGGKTKDMANIEKEESNLPAREPAVAGAFYPGSKSELEAEIEQYLSQVEVPEIKGQVFGLIVPHAGYAYSGLTAAYGFKLLEGQEADTVILLGNSHQEFFEGVAVWTGGAFKTPLGEVEIDNNLAEELISENDRIKDYQAPHISDHVLEVELPFLQKVLKPGFKIVPILFGNSAKDDWQILAEALAKNIQGKNILVIASTDMSHYPFYEQANYADGKTLQAIVTGQVAKLEKTISDLGKENIPGAETFLCGHDAVKTLMVLSQKRGTGEIKILKYKNSGDTASNKSRVVGYGVVAFIVNQTELSEKEQSKLLEIARQSVEAYVKKQEAPVFKVTEPALNQKQGAFVTIKKQGELRGCIGSFVYPAGASGEGGEPDIPLWEVVSQMAIAAATEDSRFMPVGQEELPELEYEISVLSPLEQIDDWNEIDYGRQGVQIKKGQRSGVFLPQVAQETGWSFEEFMANLCSQKAGLPSDCWKDPEAEIYTFTAQVFNE